MGWYGGGAAGFLEGKRRIILNWKTPPDNMTSTRTRVLKAACNVSNIRSQRKAHHVSCVPIESC